MEKKYLDQIGLQDVASYVNTRLKTVTTMPVSADNGAVRLYVGTTDSTYTQGHTYQYSTTQSKWIDITPTADISNKADKVSSATNGDLAGLDSNGNLTDSGILATNVITKSVTNGLVKNDGTIDTNTYATTTQLANKTDKVTSATTDDFATLDSNGNLTDSGINKNIIPSNASSSNKLATVSDVSAAYRPSGNATLATLPPLTEANLNRVYNMTADFTTTSDFAEGAGIEVKAGNEVGIIDISTTSTPDIKYTVLGGFIDTSGFQPKELDTPITVDGVSKTTVETALGAINTLAASNKTNISDKVDWSSYAVTGAVNILENKGTTSGIFTVDSDGVVDVYSATALSETKMFNITGGQRFTVPKGTWYFSCAPVGSSRTTYFTYIDITGADNQYDEGTPVELVSDGTLSIALDIYIRSGETPNHLKFKPMLSKSPNVPFAPYAMTNRQLTQNKVSWEDNTILGAKNLLPIDIATLKANHILGTWNDNVYNINNVTFTITTNDVGYVTEIDVDGTPSDNFNFLIYPNSSNTFYGKILNGCPANGSANTYKLLVWDETSNSGSEEYGDGRVLTHANGDTIRILIALFKDVELSHKKFYPMIREASDTDTTFVPYSDTNLELTDKVTESTTTIENNNAYVLKQGKGNMVDLNLVGGTIAWNQLIQNGNFTSTDGWLSNSGRSDFSVANGVASLTNFKAYNPLLVRNNIPIIKGHIYIVSVTAKASSNAIQLEATLRDGDWQNVDSKYWNLSTDWWNYSAILSASDDVTISGWVINCSSYDSSTRVDFSNAMIIDLTQLFGINVANAMYTMEQEKAEKGINFFRKYFALNWNTYYPYNTGQLMSVKANSRKAIGKNQLPSPQPQTKTVNGITVTVDSDGVYYITGKATTSTDILFDIQPFVIPKSRGLGGNGCLHFFNSFSNTSVLLLFYNDLALVDTWQFNGICRIADSYVGIGEKTINKVGIRITDTTSTLNGTFSPMFTNDSLIYSNFNRCVFEPYTETIYDLGNDELRGIFNLSNNELVANGDIKYSDGNIIRKYGIISLGDLTWTKSSTVTDHYRFVAQPSNLGGYAHTNNEKPNAICSKFDIINPNQSYNATTNGITTDSSGTYIFVYSDIYESLTATQFKTEMSGAYLVYELAISTTEQSTSFQNPQRAYLGGIEQMIDGGSRGVNISVPVGNNSKYYLNKSLPFIEDYTDNKTNDKVSWNNTADSIKKNIAKSVYYYDINQTQYSSVLFIDSDDLKPNTTYILSFESATAGNQYYTNENLTKQVTFTTIIGRNSIIFTTANSLDKSSSSQYDSGRGWRILKNYIAQPNLLSFDNVMLRLATISSDNYAPYVSDNAELITSKANSITGSHNILPMTLQGIKEWNTDGTWNNNVYTWRGITYTINIDSNENVTGIDVNGTASSRGWLFVHKGSSLSSVTGELDSEGGAGKAYNNTDGEIIISSGIDKSIGSLNNLAVHYSSGSQQTYIIIQNGYELDHVMFYPMVRVVGDTDTTFKPYAMTNSELTNDDKAIWTNNIKTGAVNLLPISLAQLKAINTLGTWDDNVYYYQNVNFEINSDFSINVSRTATGDGIFNIYYDVLPNSLKAGESYKLLWENTIPYFQLISYDSSNNATIVVNNNTSKSALFTLPSNAVKIQVRIAITNGTAYSQIIKPMLLVNTNVNIPYTPYAMTNKELTDNKINWKANGILGAKNLFVTKQPYSSDSDNTTITNIDTGIRVTASSAGEYRFGSCQLKLPKNTDLIFETDVTVLSGEGLIQITGGYHTLYQTDIVTSNEKISFSFNSGDYDSYSIAFFCNFGTSSVGDVKYENLMIRLLDDFDSTYQLPAMTNFELTKDKYPWETNAKDGVHNLLPIQEGYIINNGNLNISSNKDTKLVTVTSNNVQTTANNYYHYAARTQKQFKLPVGNYILIPNKTGTDSSYMTLGSGNSGDGITSTFESWVGNTTEAKEFYVDEARSNRYISCGIQCDINNVYNSTYHAMIIRIDDPITDYQPYSKSNAELTNIYQFTPTSGHSKITIDTSLSKVVRQNNVVHVRIRFTLTEAISGEFAIANIYHMGVVGYPMFIIANRNAPYAPIRGAYLSGVWDDTLGPNGLYYPIKTDGGTLEAGTYDVYGTFICRGAYM